MNEFLANLYGTAQDVGASTGDDAEKLAQAQILDQMFEAEGINIDELHPQTVVKVAEAIFGDNTKIAEEDVETAQHEKDEKKDAEEKLAEADFLGRVMAHSFENERREIEKTALSASNIGRSGLNLGKRGVEAVGRGLGHIGSTVTKPIKGAVERAAEKSVTRKAIKDVAKMPGSGYEKNQLVDALRKGEVGFSPNELTAAKRKIHRAVGGAVAGGGLLAAGAGTAAAMHKKESALDILAEQRAAEILSQYGVSSGEEKLASAVEQRAWEMLAEAGYDVE